MERFSPEDLFKKGFEPDGLGGYRKIRPSAPPEVSSIAEELKKKYGHIDGTGIKGKEITNAKIKGAKKTEVDGITFASKLESYMYSLLRGAGIRFAFQKEYVLQEKFRYNGEAVREIKIIVDFELIDYNMIIDSKGWQLADGKIKYKLLKFHLSRMPGEHPRIEMPATKEECDVLLNRILYSKL